MRTPPQTTQQRKLAERSAQAQDAVRARRLLQDAACGAEVAAASKIQGAWRRLRTVRRIRRTVRMLRKQVLHEAHRCVGLSVLRLTAQPQPSSSINQQRAQERQAWLLARIRPTIGQRVASGVSSVRSTVAALRRADAAEHPLVAKMTNSLRCVAKQLECPALLGCVVPFTLLPCSLLHQFCKVKAQGRGRHLQNNGQLSGRMGGCASCGRGCVRR